MAIRNVMVVLSLVILLIPNAVALYDHSLYADGSGSPLTAVAASFKSDTQDCEIRMESFATLNKSPPPITTSITYHSPGDTVLVTGSRVFSSNVSCASYSIANTTQVSANGTLEGKTVLVHDAGSASLFLTDNHVCLGVEDFTNITINRTTADSRDFITNMYVRQKTKNCVAVVPYTVSEFTPELDSTSNWGECKFLSVSKFDKDGLSLSKGEDECYGFMFYFPVNSSVNGKIFYDLDCSTCMTVTSSAWSTIDDQRWIIYPSDTPASITTLAATTTASGSITVNPDEEYVIAYFFAAKRTTPPFTVEFDVNAPDNAEIDIFSFTPDFVCGEWSECLNSTQHRLCIDSFGKASNKFEYRSCAITVLENATLGFEESETIDDVKKCMPDWILGCSHSIASISVERPLNWTVLDPSAANKQNFLSMTQEWASEGTRSLKMWFIPPREGEPSGGICVNLTEGRIPQILQNLSNSTFATIFNVTFPAENMLFSFDVKGCADQVLHHSELRTLFDFVTICPEACYSENCSVTPQHRYFFNIVDTSDDTSLLGSPYFGNADTNLAETISIDLSSLGVVPGRDYTLVFAVFPENLNDRTGDCVMFDSVKYEVLAEPLETLVPDCVSACIGDDFYVARRLANGRCSVIINEFSPSCTDSAKAEFIANLEDYCIDSTTAAIFNEVIAKYTEIICDLECSSGRCITEEEAEEETIEDFQDTTDIEGMIAALTSKFAIGFYIIAILSGISGAATKQWQIGAITAIGALFLVVFGGLWPLEIGFVVAAFILILFAAVGTNAVLGKAGG